ncbi:MAG: hypothetical protein F4X87_03990 [Chloroflexi bacterium]|nr:hypothetical protein [Chloroflexota bacterium]
MSLQGHNSDIAQSAGQSIGANSGAGIFFSNPRIQKLIEAGPRRSTVLLVVIGMVIGMIAAYVVIPTEFTGASPRHMSQQAIQQWVRMVAVGHSQDVHYDDGNALLVLQQIPNPQSVVEGLARSAAIPAAERAALESLTDIDGFDSLAGPLAPQDPGIFASSLQIALALAAVAVVIPVLTIAGRTILPSGYGADEKIRKGSSAAPTAGSQVSPAARAAPTSNRAQSEAPPTSPWADDETEKSGTLHPQFGVPVLHTVSTYVKGQNYDDSFAIETGPEQGNQFLGECGVSIATRVGNELQSVEFWGFDMASQETATKVFAAPAALSDPALLSAVANRVKDPTSDIVAAEPGVKLIVDNSAIQIQAEVKTIICNYGGGTPNSGIETLQIELLAWHKQGQGASVPAAGYPAPAHSPFNQYADLQIAPPTQASSPAPPPPAAGASAPPQASGSAQPAKRPEDEEEDPFGGTGNFMPYS